jgi:hypothetical protein
MMKSSSVSVPISDVQLATGCEGWSIWSATGGIAVMHPRSSALLSTCGSGEWGQRDSARCQMQKSTARKFHGAPLSEMLATRRLHSPPRTTPEISSTPSIKSINAARCCGRTGANPTPQFPKMAVETPCQHEGVMSGSHIACPS